MKEMLCSLRPVSMKVLKKKLRTIMHEHGLLETVRCFAFTFKLRPIECVITWNADRGKAFVNNDGQMIYFPSYNYDGVRGVIEWLQNPVSAQEMETSISTQVSESTISMLQVVQ